MPRKHRFAAVMTLVVICPLNLPSAEQANAAERVDVLNSHSLWRYYVVFREPVVGSAQDVDPDVRPPSSWRLRGGDFRSPLPPLDWHQVDFDDTSWARGNGPLYGGYGDNRPAGTVADFDGDGAQDLAFVTIEGQVWLLLRATERGPGPGVSVALPTDEAGSLNIVGFDRDRCLGAQRVGPGQPAFFGKRNKGPIRLQWQRHSQPKQTKQVIVLKSTRFQLPGE